MGAISGNGTGGHYPGRARAGSLTPVNPSAPGQDTVARAVLGALAGAPLPEWETVAAALEVCELAPGQVLFNAGARAPHVFFVRRGILRLAYESGDGRHRIKGFVPEGRFFASARALAGDGRAAFRADALEAACVERLDYAVLERLAAVHLPWQAALASGFRVFGLRKEQREHDLLVLDAGARYRRFLEDYADVAGRIPLKDVAAYIGVTPVGLSRIRRRLGLVGGEPHGPRAAAAPVARPRHAGAHP
ncbi:MAG TPA: Crp/Fnr family transcriptional regulator [Pseudoxanthomonas sp.]|nr:Crp/Fnr family transcriptional regulator [Pseudoxanthomonas sp.]